MPEYQDPAVPPDQVRVDSWSAKVGRERHWYYPWTWSHSSYIIEKRTFNRFEDDEVPSQAKRRTVESPSGATREASDNGTCWTEEQVDVFTYVTPHFIKKRWVEYWRVNETLEEYYAIVRDWGQTAADLASDAKAVAQGAGLKTSSSGTTVPSPGGMIATAAAGAAVAGPALAAAAGTAAEGLVVGASFGAGALTEVAAVGASAVYAGATTGAAVGSAVVTVGRQVAVPVIAGVTTFMVTFVGTTRLMERTVKSSEKISEGWELVNVYDGPEAFESSVGVWRQVGPVRDCPGLLEEHWTTPQPKGGPRFSWPRWWWLGGILLVGALALIGGGLLLTGGHAGTSPAATATAAGGSARAASPPATPTAVASAVATPGPVGLGWTGTTVELTFRDLTFGQCATSQRAGVPPTFSGGWTMATEPRAGTDVALNMVGLPTSPFAPALNGSIAPTGGLHVTGDSAIESMDLSLNVPFVPAGPLLAPLDVTGSAQVALHAAAGDCQTAWNVSGTLTPPGASVPTAAPSATVVAGFSLGLVLNYGHSGATSSVCLTVSSAPAQPGGSVTATISGPGVVGPSRISSTLLGDGSRHGHFSIDRYGTYVVATSVTSHGVAHDSTQTIDVTAAPGQGQCP